MNPPKPLKRASGQPAVQRCAAAVALAFAACLAHGQTAQPAPAATAAERESLEALRETTLALIDLLVANGTLSRDKADQLLAEARKRAAAKATPAPGTWGSPPTAPVTAAAPTPVTRVPYVPQIVRDQIRNELREEIVAKARAERWGVPNATAEWTDRITVEGDLRVRGQQDRYDEANASPLELVAASQAGLVTRVPDLATVTAAGLPTANTQDDRNRTRVRARLGVTAL